jgi:hypothetical protein
MNAFVQRHLSHVTGVISGFDRLRFRGTLRMLAHTGGFASFLRLVGVKLKDFGAYAERTTREVREATERVAEEAGRPLLYVSDPSASKEDTAREIAKRDGVEKGLVCVLKSVEPCHSYDVRKWGSPELKGGTRKCLHYYHYLIHPVASCGHNCANVRCTGLMCSSGLPRERAYATTSAVPPLPPAGLPSQTASISSDLSTTRRPAARYASSRVPGVSRTSICARLTNSR